MTVAEDHASIDHGGEVGRDCAPAVALNVNEAQEDRILDVLAGVVPCVARHVLDQGQASQWVLEELCNSKQVIFRQAPANPGCRNKVSEPPSRLWNQATA